MSAELSSSLISLSGSSSPGSPCPPGMTAKTTARGRGAVAPLSTAEASALT
jgi:hypothetical protein